MVPTLRGIFFDLDDTLIAYTAAEEHALAVGCRIAAERVPGLVASQLADALFEAYLNNFEYGTDGYATLKHLTTRELRLALTEDALKRLGIPAEPEFLTTLLNAYAQAEASALNTYADTVETLEALRPHFRLGVITNGPSAMQRDKIALVALARHFDVIIVDTEFGLPKPDARIFYHAAEQVGLEANEMLFVGNSLESDVAGSNAGGWTSVWYCPDSAPPRPTAPGLTPVYTISTLKEVLSLPPVARVLRSEE